MSQSKQYIDSNQMMRELMGSVRDLNRRLSELKTLLVSDSIKKEKKAEVIDRYKRLTKTKFELIYSIYDVRQRFIKQVSCDLNKKNIEEDFALKTLFKNLSTV